MPLIHVLSDTRCESHEGVVWFGVCQATVLPVFGVIVVQTTFVPAVFSAAPIVPIWLSIVAAVMPVRRVGR